MRIENTSATNRVQYINPTKTEVTEPIPQYDILTHEYYDKMGADEFVSYLANLLKIDLQIKKPRKSKKESEEAS